ncbi:FadR family transcriptional regulator [Deferribacterales bacterium Es71-Z0220]|uniref:FadR/GntR family transcriptional regulator n=1 Tax=Deferrivibrio essentukiensis TaxID=2880922 RepID=UPI001F602D2D|nr:FadR/GntR family transcriptional regulator [Deferrivibrio essentukiensis]MCB4204241.1 FadR family transcriptional regulator [Deferrivibrio essentukiensis]
MVFKKIKPKKISDEIYEQIKELILTGKLKPGEKLPPERELATTLGVSRPSIREALQKLEAQGFLEQIQGDGTYVKVATSEAFDSFLEEFARKDNAIFDLMEVRRILETWAAYTAAERADEKEIAQMQEYLNEMKDAKDYGQIGYIADANFHSTISYATHNVLLIHIMNNIYEWIEKVSYEVRSRMYTDEKSHEELFNQHSAIFNAIKDGKPLAAYNAMNLHMDYIVKELNKVFKK